MNDQSDATLSSIAAAKWLCIIEEHAELMSATLHTLILDLERAGVRVLGVPTTISLRREIELLRAGLSRVSGELGRTEGASSASVEVSLLT